MAITIVGLEVDGSSEALHHSTVRQRDREWESERETNERENECFFNNSFLNFFKLPKNKHHQNDIILAHLTTIDNWGPTEYQIDNN